jgi:hypothetical protein
VSTLAERVRDGAALIEERWPGALERVDMDMLSMSSATRCVLGQVMANRGEGDYYHGVRALGLEHFDTKPGDPASVYRFGFTFTDGPGDTWYHELPALRDAALWALEIEWRRLLLELRQPV